SRSHECPERTSEDHCKLQTANCKLKRRNKKPEHDHPCGCHAPVVSHSGIGRIGLGTDPTGAARRPAAGVQESGPWSSCSAASCRTRTSTAWTKKRYSAAGERRPSTGPAASTASASSAPREPS